MTTPPVPPPGNPYGAPPPAPQNPYAAPPQHPYGAPPPYAGYGTGPQPYGFGHDRPSKAMAGWSLGLALAFVVPFALFVSVGLAIAVLVRSRDGRDHGRGMAIAALVIDLVLVLLVAALVVLAIVSSPGGTQRGTAGQVTSSQQASVFEVRAGDCVNDDNLFGSDEATTSTTVQVVPCAGSRQMEAYLVQDLPDGAFPGSDAVTTSAQDLCSRAFRAFVGTAPRRSELGLYYYVPTAVTWDRADDRAVTCMVGATGSETTGSLRGSGR